MLARMYRRFSRIYAAVCALAWTVSSCFAASPRYETNLLLRVDARTPVPVADLHATMDVGRQVPLLQENDRYYIAAVIQGGADPRVCCFPRNVSSGPCGWVTGEKVLVFAFQTQSERGSLYLEEGLELPVLEESATEWRVRYEKNGAAVELTLPRSMKTLTRTERIVIIESPEPEVEPPAPGVANPAPTDVVPPPVVPAPPTSTPVVVVTPPAVAVTTPPPAVVVVTPPPPVVTSTPPPVIVTPPAVVVAHPPVVTPPAMATARPSSVAPAPQPAPAGEQGDGDLSTFLIQRLLPMVGAFLLLVAIILALRTGVRSLRSRRHAAPPPPPGVSYRPSPTPDTDRVSAPPPAPESEEPQLPAAVSGKGDLSGTIDGPAFTQVVQFFCAARESGRMFLKDAAGGTPDELTFVDGQIVDAKSGLLRGRDAALHILKRRGGVFLFKRVSLEGVPDVVKQDTISLLLEVRPPGGKQTA